MKILYATDLHGQTKKFEAVIKIIDDHDLIIIGADVIPKSDNEKSILYFLEDYLPTFFDRISIPIIIDFGNDDWYMYYDKLRDLVDLYSHVYISHLDEVKIWNYTFIGMHYVPDYPFGIKDWCRRDSDKICDSEQFGIPWKSENGKKEIIKSLYRYFMKRPSIRDMLDTLSAPDDKTIYLIHSPPIQSGLDVCFRSGPVGSRDVLKWIHDTKPWLTLHGHIHESYEITGIAINKIGDTICINPGQKGGYGYSNFVWCEFNLNDIEGTFIRKEMKQ